MANNRDIGELMDILNRIETQIANCDAKITAVLGCIGVMVGIFLATDTATKLIRLMYYILDKPNWLHIIIILGCLSTIFVIVSGIWQLFFALLARIDSTEYGDKKLNTESNIYFENIARKKDYSTYLKKIKSCDIEFLKEDYISQIYICSKICTLKYAHYNKGLKWSGIGFLLSGGITILCIIIRHYGL